jgi:hypothetical protein
LSNQNHFTIFHIPVLTTALDHSQVIPSQKWRFMNQCIPAGYSETHVSLVPQAQIRPTHSTPIEGSRSPSKLGLQAPSLETRSQYGA